MERHTHVPLNHGRFSGSKQGSGLQTGGEFNTKIGLMSVWGCVGFKHTESCLLGYRESEAPADVPGGDFGLFLHTLVSLVRRLAVIFKTVLYSFKKILHLPSSVNIA